VSTGGGTALRPSTHSAPLSHPPPSPLPPGPEPTAPDPTLQVKRGAAKRRKTAKDIKASTPFELKRDGAGRELRGKLGLAVEWREGDTASMNYLRHGLAHDANAALASSGLGPSGDGGGGGSGEGGDGGSAAVARLPGGFGRAGGRTNADRAAAGRAEAARRFGDRSFVDDDELRVLRGERRADPAAVAARAPPPLTSEQLRVVSALVDAHGDDVEAMTRDLRLNALQHTAGKLRKLLSSFNHHGGAEADGASTRHAFRAPKKSKGGKRSARRA